MTQTSQTFITMAKHDGLRLDKFLCLMLNTDDRSRGEIQEAIRSGLVQIDGRTCTKPAHKIKAGTTIVCSFSQTEGQAALEPDSSPLKILYADQDLAVVAKPHGLCTHPAPGLIETTLAHRLVHQFPELARPGDQRPGIVHRLDKDTSGLLVAARTPAARLALGKQFAARTIGKHYLAIVHGVPPEKEGRLDAPIGRHPVNRTKMAVVNKGGRSALTSWVRIWHTPDKDFSLLKVRIHTGRTHQIRVHLAHLGHPIVGDSVYGIKPDLKKHPLLPKLARRQLLHAWHVHLTHPLRQKELDLHLPPPPDFMQTALYLARRPMVLGLTGLPGAGKSALARILKQQKIPVWSADECVHRLYQPGGHGWEMIRRTFGLTFCTEDQSIDRKALLQAMLETPDLRREIENVIHPLVALDLREFLARHKDERLMAAEIPLLHESRAVNPQMFDLTVGIFRPENTRHQILKARGWDRKTLAAMQSWHHPARVKYRLCDLIIDNSHDLAHLERTANSLLTLLKRRRQARMRRLKNHLENFFSRKIDGMPQE